MITTQICNLFIGIAIVRLLGSVVLGRVGQEPVLDEVVDVEAVVWVLLQGLLDEQLGAHRDLRREGELALGKKEGTFRMLFIVYLRLMW